MKRGYWLARAAGGAAAGVLMAGAGVGVAIAGASGNSDQYTKGAKPYAGVHPNDVTVGTHTFPSTVTTNITNTTVTQPYAVTKPYAVTTATIPSSVLALLTAEGTLNAAYLKPDLRTLLEPTGNYLKIRTLARAKAVTFAFVSPGPGKLLVSWKVTTKVTSKFTAKVSHTTTTRTRTVTKSAYYINYGGRLLRTGAITVKLPTTLAGRKALTGATSGAISAAVTYTPSTGKATKVVRAYKLTS